MKKTKTYISGITAGLVTFIALTAGFGLALAVWQPPVVAPPGDNVDPFSADLYDVLEAGSDASGFVGDVNIGDASNAANLYLEGGELSAKWIHGYGDGDNSFFGNLKVGSGAASQKVDVDGAVRIDNTDVELGGMIRYTGTDFEGWLDGQWVSLTPQE